MKKLVTLIAVLALATQSMALDWKFYGSARVSTFYQWALSPIDGVDPVASSNFTLQGNARVGAKVSGKNFKGGFEYGASSGKANVRKLYGEWLINKDVSLLIGQTYSPLCFFPSNQVYGDDLDLILSGAVYNGRHAMIQLNAYGASLALMAPKVTNPIGTVANATDTLVYESTKAHLPKVEAYYKHSDKSYHVGLGLGFNMNKVETKGTLFGNYKENYTVVSFASVLDLGFKMGTFYVYTTPAFVMNSNNYGLVTSSPYSATSYTDGTDLKLAPALSILVPGALGLNVTKNIALEAGAGGEIHMLTIPADSKVSNAKDKKQSYIVLTAYLQAAIKAGSNVVIYPEVGFSPITSMKKDDGISKTTDKQPGKFYIGAKWQANF